MNCIIGITETEACYENYPLWIKGDDSGIEVIKLTKERIDDVDKCDGIVLSGGIDTHPLFYNNDNISYPNAPKKFKEERDEFELEVFRYALEKKIPVLGICRGMQLVNIALGGDLIQDIEASGSADHKRHGDADGMHEVGIEKNSLLHEIAGSEKGAINSAHHQALATIAPGLRVNAWSPDGIAEGAEWKDKADKPFLLCVQWHPERLVKMQPDNPLTAGIRKKFVETVKNNKR